MGKSIIIRLLVMAIALLVMSCGGDEAQAHRETLYYHW